MNWREFLSIDVASLFRGDEPPRVAPTMFTRRRREPREAEPPELESRVETESWRGPWYMRRKKWRRDLLLVTEQLAAIIRSNSPLIGGLEAAALDAPSVRLQEIFLVLRDDIASGFSLTQAMLRRPRFFPRFYTDLVKVGEETGRLQSVLMRLIDQLLEAAEFAIISRNYLLYITVVLGFLCAVQMFLYVRIIPVFVELFTDFGAEVPRSTRTLIAISNYVAGGGWITIAVVICLCAIVGKMLYRLVQRRERLRAATAGLLMCVPFLRGLVVKFNLAQAAFGLGKLLEGGIPLDAALEDAASLDINPLYRAAMRRLKERVQNGETLNAAMEMEPLLPESFRGFVSIGESSGLLPEAFGRVAQLYRRQALKTSRILMDVLTPIGVVVLGCFTLLVTLSVLGTCAALYEALLASI